MAEDATVGREVLGDGAAAGRASDGRVGGACGLRLLGTWLVVTVVTVAAVAARWQLWMWH